LSQEDLYRATGSSKKLQDVVFDVASAAKIHLDTARSFKQSVPKAALPALQSSVRHTLSFVYLTFYVGYL
jgi:hypothetical protein